MRRQPSVRLSRLSPLALASCLAGVGTLPDVRAALQSALEKMRTGVAQELLKCKEAENVFIKLTFDGRYPYQAEIKDVNSETLLTKRQVEVTTSTTVDSWFLFIKKVSFELVGVDKITLFDDASLFSMDKSGKWHHINGRILNLIMGKEDYSFYQKYGWVNDEYTIYDHTSAIKFTHDFLKADDFEHAIE